MNLATAISNLNNISLINTLKNCGKTFLLLHVVRKLQLTKKKKTTKSGKRRRCFLHDGALALASKVSSGYCTVPLLHRRCLSPVLTSVQEYSATFLLYYGIQATTNIPTWIALPCCLIYQALIYSSYKTNDSTTKSHPFQTYCHNLPIYQLYRMLSYKINEGCNIPLLDMALICLSSTWSLHPIPFLNPPCSSASSCFSSTTCYSLMYNTAHLYGHQCCTPEVIHHTCKHHFSSCMGIGTMAFFLHLEGVIPFLQHQLNRLHQNVYKDITTQHFCTTSSLVISALTSLQGSSATISPDSSYPSATSPLFSTCSKHTLLLHSLVHYLPLYHIGS